MVHWGGNDPSRHCSNQIDEWPWVLIRALGTHSTSLFNETKLIPHTNSGKCQVVQSASDKSEGEREKDRGERDSKIVSFGCLVD